MSPYYLLYKFFALLAKKTSFGRYSNKLYPGLWSNTLKDKEFKVEKVVFNFSDQRFTHLGDQLFFLKTIVSLNQFFIVEVKTNSYLKNFWKFAINNTTKNAPSIDSVVIYIEPAYKKFYTVDKGNNLYLYYDVMDYEIKDVVPDYFCQNILSILGVEENLYRKFTTRKYLNELFSQFSQNSKFSTEKGMVLFSPFVSSGRFRLFFLRGRNFSFFSILKSLSRSNKSQISLIGSAEDKLPREFKNNIKYVDLRGDLRFEDIIFLLVKRKVLAYVGYDNFIMHLSQFFDCQSYVLFRGRFSKKAEKFHYKYVNSAFSSNGSEKIKYLNLEWSKRE